MRRLAAAAATLCVVAGLGLASAGVADAAPVPASPSAAVHPDMCRSGGPYIDITHNYGEVFHKASQEFTDHNGGSLTATMSFTNNWSGTVSSTVSASINVSVTDIVATVNAQLGLSTTKTESITTGHTDSFQIPGHEYGHAEYGAWQQKVEVESYLMNGGCKAYDQEYTTAYADRGSGWDFWTTTS